MKKFNRDNFKNISLWFVNNSYTSTFQIKTNLTKKTKVIINIATGLKAIKIPD